jgi:hypothetical protein
MQVGTAFQPDSLSKVLGGEAAISSAQNWDEIGRWILVVDHRAFSLGG